MALLGLRSHLGPLLAACQDGAIPRRARRKALVLIWISIPLSILFLARAIWLQTLLLLIAIAVTIYLLRLPTAAPDPE